MNNSSSPFSHRSSKLWYLICLLLFGYYAQGTLYPVGNPISQSILTLIILIGLYELIASIFLSKQKLPVPLVMSILFWLLIALTFLLSPPKVLGISTLSQFKDITAFFLPLFIGFQIGLKHKITLRQATITSIIILGIAIMQYMQAWQLKLFSEEFTNNSAYYFLYIIPFVALMYNKRLLLSATLMVVVFAFVMSGAKRGAIVCLGLCVIYMAYYYTREHGIGIKSFVVVAILIGGAFYGVNYYLEHNAYLVKRLESTQEGSTSGRDKLAEKLWDGWKEASIIQQIVGRGSAQTLEVAGNYAHNDWLETLTNNGIIGVLLYLGLFYSFFKYRKKLARRSQVQLAYNLTLIFWFARTLFSMSMNIIGGLTMMMLGLFIGNRQIEFRYNKLISEANHD